jgi:hypothetical protein
MRNIRQKISIVFFLFLVVVVFRAWYSSGIITGGDFLYYSPSMFSSHLLFPFAWSSVLGNGIGANSVPFLWILTNFGGSINFFGSLLGLPWVIIERVAYLYPFIVFSSVFPAILYRKLFPEKNIYILSSIVYLFNTYVLMIIGGGQIAGIGMAYTLIPLIIYFFLSKEKQLIAIISVSALLALQLIFDLRIFYITFFSLFLLTFFIESPKNYIKAFFAKILVPLFLVSLIHLFWILPLLLHPANPINALGDAYSSIEAVKFFSFAKLENTLSLLHPNWPENIFGKVSFMHPEFLIIPILAFTSLIFIGNETKEKRRYILFFALIGLIGAFLAKGSNEPFGVMYLWAFEHVPGFQMFRDPTKWYILVALSYSILIPYSVWRIYDFLKLKQKLKFFNFKFQINIQNSVLNLQNLFVVVFVLFWLFTIRQAVLGQLGGTFKATSVPNEYTKLEKFFSTDNNFSRIFWLPTTQRFGYYSNQHPAMSAMSFYNQTSTIGVLQEFNNPSTEIQLQKASVKYVIIPYDSQKEIFLKDRQYDETQYQSAVSTLRNIPWLNQVDGFGNIKVFEVTNPKKHFWINGDGAVSFNFINPTKYKVVFDHVKMGEKLIFSESFDKNWIFKLNNINMHAQQFEGRFNSFVIPKDGSYSAEIYYEPQKWVVIGSFISLTTVIVLLIGIICISYRKYRRNH